MDYQNQMGQISGIITTAHKVTIQQEAKETLTGEGSLSVFHTA